MGKRTGEMEGEEREEKEGKEGSFIHSRLWKLPQFLSQLNISTQTLCAIREMKTKIISGIKHLIT